MKKEDLKDGMILETKAGTESQIISNGKSLYDVTHSIKSTRSLDIYDKFLSHTYQRAMDIVKASYMGEELWKTKEYFTFEEARKSGRLFRHKDWFTRYYDVRGVMDVVIKSSVRAEEINRILDEKVWELGEN